MYSATARIAALLAGTALLVGCAPAQLAPGGTADVRQDAGIAINAARQQVAQAEALPLQREFSCGPFKVGIHSPRIAPGPVADQVGTDGAIPPHLAIVIEAPDDLDGRVSFRRATTPLDEARIYRQTRAGWQEVTSPAAAVALGASVAVNIDASNGSPNGAPMSGPARHEDLSLGFDPARDPYLFVDRKFAVHDMWTVVRQPGDADVNMTGATLPAGLYRVSTQAKYQLDSSAGGCAFTLPDLQWRMPG